MHLSKKILYFLFMSLLLIALQCRNHGMPENLEFILENDEEIDNVEIETSQYNFVHKDKNLLVLRREYEYDSRDSAEKGYASLKPQRPVESGKSDEIEFSKSRNALWMLKKDDVVYIQVVLNEAEYNAMNAESKKQLDSAIENLLSEILKLHQN
ncbi:MAG: hypothetical protein KDK41_04375 [Leptospiraceae bacterium]|nr:hypothetical protein [Leptospiraceae bacterium]MCB1199857.1 hypothetical protein [Leptospiraceae bacterium]